jgi:hypothetical protein
VSNEARYKLIQEQRKRYGAPQNDRESRDGCGQSNPFQHWQQNVYKVDPEEDVAEVTQSVVKYIWFIWCISDMSGFENDIDETNAQVTSRETVKPTILFTNTEAPDEEDPNHALKME